ncbi:hypothetical protein DRQ53_00535 [bacterium]|nr:MAG: hypothetical protein DRQ32_01685 [bacterium]RKZ18376.1 MAG: hypothetical protein DRQ53_00535 [bacterium]
MLRFLPALILLATVLAPAHAVAQNPFLQNQGRRVIKSIQFEGYERTKLYVLERELGMSAGDDYDAAAVNDAWARLEQLPFIAYIEIETDRPRPGEVELLINVVEEDILRWQLGLEYSRRLEPRWYGDVRLGAVNLLGRADELELQLDAWALRRARLRWANPWILGAAKLGVRVEVGAFAHQWVYDPAPDATNSEFAVEGGLWREFGDMKLSLAGRWRHSELDDIPAFPDSNTFGPQIGNGQPRVKVDEPALLASIGYDNRDSEFYPGRGVDAAVDFVYAAPNGDFNDWSTVDLSLATFVPLPWIHTIGGYVTRRFASDPLPWYERSYFGGPDDLRGVPFASRRGDEHIRASLEIRRPLFVVPLRAGRSIGLGLHAFSDWGAAWEHDEHLSDQKLANSFGAGAHFNFNTYNYRFEWAHHDGENTFVFEDHFTF